jgi:hypothetical protein
MNKEIERRFVDVQHRTTDNGEMILEGLAIPFNSPCKLGNYTEIISPSAFRNTNLDNVKMIFNHDENSIPLASTTNQSLFLQTDELGLKFHAKLDNTQNSKDMYQRVKSGLISKISLGFSISNEKWEKQQRTVTGIGRVFELSLVTDPAYTETSVVARNLEKARKNQLTEFELRKRKSKAKLKLKLGD